MDIPTNCCINSRHKFHHSVITVWVAKQFNSIFCRRRSSRLYWNQLYVRKANDSKICFYKTLHYITRQIIFTFLLVSTYGLMKNRSIDDIFKVPMKWNFCLLFNSKILKSMILWFIIFEFGLRTNACKFFLELQSWPIRVKMCDILHTVEICKLGQLTS